MEGTAAGGGSGTCGGNGGGGGEGERLSDQQKLQVLRREFLKLREEHTQLQSQLAEFSKLKAKVRRAPPPLTLRSFLAFAFASHFRYYQYYYFIIIII
jgi:hypothetical protein